MRCKLCECEQGEPRLGGFCLPCFDRVEALRWYGGEAYRLGSDRATLDDPDVVIVPSGWEHV
jgi:hypothetical protein